MDKLKRKPYREKRYYVYVQNNSGGFFVAQGPGQLPLGDRVIIEARSFNEANEIAERVGIYFHGVEEGIDCECCGDRWNQKWTDEVNQWGVLTLDQANAPVNASFSKYTSEGIPVTRFGEAETSGVHKSHKMKFSLSDAYDELCTNCGCNDFFNKKELREPCTNEVKPHEEI